MEEREKLTEQLIATKNQLKEIREKLEAIDYKDRLSEAKQYEGKFFKELRDSDNYVRCLFVYSTDKDRCEPMCLSLNYYLDNETSYFTIDYDNTFFPKKWDEDDDRWVEISKEEYMQHYNEVQRRISLALNKTN